MIDKVDEIFAYAAKFESVGTANPVRPFGIREFERPLIWYGRAFAVSRGWALGGQEFRERLILDHALAGTFALGK